MLVEEIQRYLAVVDVFRAEGCGLVTARRREKAMIIAGT